MMILHHVHPPLLLLGMLLHPWCANAQSTTALVSSSAVVTTSRAVTTSSKIATSTSASAVISTTAVTTSATASTTTTYTGVPSLSFGAVQTVTACGSGQAITWHVSNEDSSKVNITLYAVNEGVDQSIPAASTTSSSTSLSSVSISAAASTSSASTSVSKSLAATTSSAAATSAAVSSVKAASTTAVTSLVARAEHVPRSVLNNINVTLATQLANHAWNWNTVQLPEGRYYILGVVDDGHGTTAKSAVFSVVESSNTSCLSAFASESKTATASAMSTNVATGTAVGAGSGSTSTGGGISKGAIAGIAVGAILGLAALGLIAFLCLRRRQRSESSGGDDRYTAQPPMSTTSGRHVKMPSGPASPSDPTHGQGPIALGALRVDGSYRTDAEKGRSIESLVETMNDTVSPVVLRDPVTGRPRDPSDPFATPRLPDSSNAYGGFSEKDFNPSHQVGGSAFSPISTPAPAVLPRPTSYSDSRSRRQSGPVPAPPVHRSQSQSRLAGDTTPPGIGLGIASAPTTPAHGQIGRSSSTRRKPVPSLGPELRTELAKQTNQGQITPPIPGSSGQGERRTSYKLVPDPPLRLSG